MEQNKLARRGWLSSIQRGRGSSIRDYVHGKIVKNGTTTLGGARDSSEPDSSGKSARNCGVGQGRLKQLTLDILIKSSKKKHRRRTTAPVIMKQSPNPWKNGILASVVTRGVRKKASSTGTLVTKSHNRLRTGQDIDKENGTFDDPLPNIGDEIRPCRTDVCPKVAPGLSNAMLRQKAWQRERVETTPSVSDTYPKVASVPKHLPCGNCKLACVSDEHTNSRTDYEAVEGQEPSSDDLEYVPLSPSGQDYSYANTEELLAELSYCEKIKT